MDFATPTLVSIRERVQKVLKPVTTVGVCRDTVERTAKVGLWHCGFSPKRHLVHPN